MRSRAARAFFSVATAVCSAALASVACSTPASRQDASTRASEDGGPGAPAQPRPTAAVVAGEIWIDGARITDTQGAIVGFSTSPSGRYVAAHLVIGAEPGHNDGDPSASSDEEMIPIYALVMIDATKRSVLARVDAPEELLHLGEWTRDDKYRFATGSELDVVGMYEFDPRAATTRALEFDHAKGQYR